MAGKARPFGAPFGARLGFASAGVALGWSGPGALAIRSLAVKRGGIGRLTIEQVGRPRELIVDQEREQEA